ncbi:MAG: hypothetical protein Kow0077_17720 [Anaerolineae bacterium]
MLIDILPRAFHYPEHEAWNLQPDELDELLDAMRAVRRLWPVIRVLQAFLPPVRDLMRGFVWEADGQPVGMVNVTRQGGSTNWLIGNVAVLPAYRRRGIARQLVSAAVDLARSKGAERIVLDVVRGNEPAIQLYERLGFTRFSGSVEFSFTPCPDAPPEDVLLPSGYRFGPLPRFDWQTRYTFDSRIRPAPVRRYEPVDVRRYRIPAALRPVLRLFEQHMGARTLHFALQRGDGRVIALASYNVRVRAGGVVTLRLHADPAHPEPVQAVLQHVLYEAVRANPGRRVEMSVPEWQPAVVAAGEALGFARRCVYERMGLILVESPAPAREGASR